MANLYKIKNLAKEKGWSLSYICSKMGVAASYFTDVKNGKLKISPERLQQIADILGTTPEYLTDQTDETKKHQSDESDWRDKLEDILNELSSEQLERLGINLFLQLSPKNQEDALKYLQYLESLDKSSGDK